MATSTGIDKILLATVAERMDSKLEFSKKWNNGKDDFKTGDVVLVLSTDNPRGQWPLGQITKTFSGSDGRVRVVDVQVGRNELTGSAHKLVPHECDNQIDEL